MSRHRLMSVRAAIPRALSTRPRRRDPDFTGISAPYEAPEACEIEVDTGELDVTQSTEKMIDYIERNFPHTSENN